MSTRKRSEKEWRSAVARWRRSGKSTADFARELGVAPRTLTWWAWKLGSRSPESRSPEPKEAQAHPEFVEVVPLRVVETGPSIEVAFDDVVVRVRDGFDPDTLKHVLGVLREGK